MSKDIYIYDRASGRCLAERAPMALASELTATSPKGLKSRLSRPALDQKGFFGCSTASPDAVDAEVVFKSVNKLYLVKCNEGPLDGEAVLFESQAGIAAYFDWKVKSISTRIAAGKRLPGGSDWSYVTKPDPRLAKVSRWDPVNGLWDLDVDLSELKPRASYSPRRTQSKKRSCLLEEVQ